MNTTLLVPASAYESGDRQSETVVDVDENSNVDSVLSKVGQFTDRSKLTLAKQFSKAMKGVKLYPTNTEKVAAAFKHWQCCADAETRSLEDINPATAELPKNVDTKKGMHTPIGEFLYAFAVETVACLANVAKSVWRLTELATSYDSLEIREDEDAGHAA